MSALVYNNVSPAELLKKLSVALENKDRYTIEGCMVESKLIGMDVEKYGVLRRGQEYIRLIKSLQLALKLKDIDILTEAIRAAREAEFDGPEVAECRQMRKELCQIARRAADVLRAFDVDEMKVVVSEAEELEFVNSDIMSMVDILKHKSVEKLLQMQLKAAVESKDFKRVSLLTRQVKNRYFQKYGHLFNLAQYPKLRSPAASNGESSRKFMSFTPVPISNSMLRLTTFSSIREAKKMFKKVMKFMGDRDTPKMIVEIAVDILEVAMANEEMRDEIYMHIMKQLTNNPSEESQVRGWDLLHLCLKMFPPGNDLENYMEMWIRANSEELDYSLEVFHCSMKTAVGEVPSQDEILRILLRAEDMIVRPLLIESP